MNTPHKIQTAWVFDEQQMQAALINFFSQPHWLIKDEAKRTEHMRAVIQFLKSDHAKKLRVSRTEVIHAL